MSKKDDLYFFILWGTVVFVFLITVFRFITDGIHIFADLIGIIVIGLLIWIWFGTGYRIENDTIKIQSGPFKWKINIQGIRKIHKEKSIMSSPALAVDRLTIHYGRFDQIQISPKNEAEFIKLLLHKNPQIQINERLSNTSDYEL